MKAYLVLYNLASCLGWAYVLYLVILSAQRHDTPVQLWEHAGSALKIVQTAAALELVHSLIGLVPSPFTTALPQVGSRLLLTWVYTNNIPQAQAHWSLYLMIASWALVEVPRYLFYTWNLLGTTPAPLFFLRYSLFMVLYPSGITGEIGQIVASLPFLKSSSQFVLLYLSLFALLLYIPGSPFMYFHMVSQRKKATQKRKETMGGGGKKEEGLLFPKDKKGERSSTQIGKMAFAASAAAAGDVLAQEAVQKERDWRFGYAKHVVKNVKLCAKDAKTCIKAAEAGLKFLHENFDFVRDGKTLKLADAMTTFKGTFITREITGRGRKPANFEVDVPYKGQRLTGQQLKMQIDKWVSYGTIEKEAGDAILRIAGDKASLDLSDSYFVLLGAGSAMGPLLALLSLGANVIAVDLDRTAIWRRLLQLASDSCGKMYFPIKKEMSPAATIDELAEQAGCNLFTQTPEICNWLKSVVPRERLILGAYAYLDGAAHVQVSLAMDAIMAGVCEARKDTGLAYLCSPTDVFIRPKAAHDAAKENLKNAPLWQKIISGLCGKTILAPSPLPPVTSEDGQLHLVDGIVVAQGPNYALAKRLQHWRAMVMRSRGHVVSSNIAPSTRTVSVVHNKQFAAAYDGMYLFKPMEIMYQETSNAVMAALLIHDFKNKDSKSHPNDDHPLLLFADGAFHGGVWRVAYKIDSIGVVAALSTYLRQYGPTALAVVAATVATVKYAINNNLAPHHWI